MKKSVVSITTIAMLCLGATTQSRAEGLEWKNQDDTAAFKAGGLIRIQNRYESWPESSNRGMGKLNSGELMLNLTGKYNNFYLNSGLALQYHDHDFYTAIEKAYVGYKFNAHNSVDAGLVYKPFAIYPYQKNGRIFHIPFYLGFGNNAAPGLNWNYDSKDWEFKLGYYPRMTKSSLRYSPESGDYDSLHGTFPFQKAYRNEKHNQFNARLVKKFETSVGKQEIGLSGAFSELHNKTTHKDGKYYALGVHADTNIKGLNIQGAVIHYRYDAKNPVGVDRDQILMGSNGLNPSYFIPAEANSYSLNVSYLLPVEGVGRLKAIKFYNNFSYLDKKRSDWSASKINATGVMFVAPPFLAWGEYIQGKNANVLGGATNSTGFTSATSKNSQKWLHRVNLNLGFVF